MGKEDTKDIHEFTAELSGGHIGGDAASTIAVAQEAVAPVELDPEKLYGLRQSDGTLKPVSLERYRDKPVRMRGTYTTATVTDFVAYVREWATDKTTVWVHPTDAKVVAVIDDGDRGADAIGWRDHRVVLTLLVTEEWARWKKASGETMNQVEFAEFVEDSLSDIVEPSGATMLELAQTLSVKRNINFRSGIKLHDGQVNLGYDEDVEGTAGEKGDISIPEKITLALAPYVGQDTFKLEARFRYRQQGPKLAMGFKLSEPELAERTILEDIAKEIREGIGSMGKVYLGEAPTAVTPQS